MVLLRQGSSRPCRVQGRRPNAWGWEVSWPNLQAEIDDLKAKNAAAEAELAHIDEMNRSVYNNQIVMYRALEAERDRLRSALEQVLKWPRNSSEDDVERYRARALLAPVEPAREEEP